MLALIGTFFQGSINKARRNKCDDGTLRKEKTNVSHSPGLKP